MCAWGLSAAHVSDEGWTVGASKALDSVQRARAVITVCSTAVDAREATELLEMLGLDPGEGKRTEQVA